MSLNYHLGKIRVVWTCEQHKRTNVTSIQTEIIKSSPFHVEWVSGWARHLTRTAVGAGAGALCVGEFDLVRELVIYVGVLVLLGESVSRYALERLLHVQRFLGRRLKVRHARLGLAPLLGAFRRYGPRLQVHFVAQQHKREVFRLSRRRLFSTPHH